MTVTAACTRSLLSGKEDGKEVKELVHQIIDDEMEVGDEGLGA